MGGLDVSAIGLLVGALGGIFSFWLGRRLSNKWRARRREKERARQLATETRQQRRARERRERGKG